MKKLLSIVLSLIILMSSFSFIFVISADEPADVTGKSGTNLFTGKAGVLTFDDISVFNESEYIKQSSDPENEGNKVIEIMEDGVLSLKEAAFDIEPQRPVKLSFKYYSTSGAAVRIWLNEDTTQNVYRYFEPSSGAWTYYETTVTGNVPYKHDANRTYWTGGDNAVVNDLIFGQWGGEEGDSFYIDDLAFTPYYKVTYDANGGEGTLEDDYFLADSYSDLDLGLNLVKDGYYLEGWSLTPDGKKVTSIVPTPGKDITLYAIWNQIPDKTVIYDLESDTPGIADGTIRVFTDEGYTSAEVALADDKGLLDEYTLFATINISDVGIGVYVVDGNRMFPSEATRLSITFKAKGVEPKTEWFDIPVANRLPAETPNYTFWVISDLHLCSDLENIDWFYMGTKATQTRKEAMGDGDTMKGDVFERGDFVILNGDLVNYGSHEDYWTVFERYVDERLNIHGVPVYLTNGNHEFYDSKTNRAENYVAESFERVFNKQLQYLEEEHKINIIRDGTGGNYYAVDIEGSKFIFVSMPEMNETKTTANYTLSDAQFAFVKEQLAEGAKSGKTNYIVSHVGLAGYPGGSAHLPELVELLKQYPNTIVCTAHSHSNLALDEHYTIVGDMTNDFTHMNDGAVSYIETDEPGDYITSYFTGQYVEVYDDKIIMKARRFDEVSQYFGHALYYIDLPGDAGGIPVLPIVIAAVAIVAASAVAVVVVTKKKKQDK